MLKKIGIIFIVAGVIYIIYGVVLFRTVSPPLQFGFLINIILYATDIIWFVFSGIVLLYCGMSIYKGRKRVVTTIGVGGHIIIISIFALSTSYVFNVLAPPYFRSTGRVVTFLLQGLSRLFSPSLSYEFFVPLCGLLLYIVSLVLFQRIGMKMINKKTSDE
jgi:hypothetical protein